MQRPPIVSNNTPLVALWSIGQLDILPELFGEILIPQAIHDEFLAANIVDRRLVLDQSPWLRVARVRDEQRIGTFPGLDLGESEVLILAEEQQARLILMDERRGRRHAKRMGQPVLGTMGILLLAKQVGLISSVRPLIEALLAAGLWLAPELVEQALLLANEPFPE